MLVVKPQNFIKSVWKVVHHQIEKNLSGVFFLGKEKIMNLNAIRVIQLFNYFEFPIWILRILINLLDSDFPIITFPFSLVNNTKSSLANDLYPIVLWGLVIFVGFFIYWWNLVLLILFESIKKGFIFVEKIGIHLSFFLQYIDIVCKISFGHVY